MLQPITRKKKKLVIDLLIHCNKIALFQVLTHFCVIVTFLQAPRTPVLYKSYTLHKNFTRGLDLSLKKLLKAFALSKTTY